jgi:hypothetical protein
MSTTTLNTAATTAGEPARPTGITTSFALWLIDAVLSVVTGVVVIATASGSSDVANLQGDARTMAVAVVVTVGGVFFVGGIVRAALALFMFRRHNWARLVLTVLGALGIVFGFSRIDDGGWLAVFAGVASLVALVVMYFPASSAYFRRS